MDTPNLPEAFQRWIDNLVSEVGILPSQHGEQWLLHLQPQQSERTVTISIMWLNNQWQLQAVTNADDWPDMYQASEQICIDFRMGRYWYCHAGPILPHERLQRLTHFLTNLQHHPFTVQCERLT